jgi:DNA polymerase III delta prime subunit
MNYNAISTPTNLDDIVYRSITEQILIKAIASGQMQFPIAGKNGILLYGIYGTGKTTLARLLPDAIEHGKGGADSNYNFIPCEQGMNGAQVISKLRQWASVIAFTHSGYHYFVLDEVDNLTDAAMESLKSAMNIPNTIFVMTTNHISRIDAGVKNRCERINCNAAAATDWLPFAHQAIARFGGAPVDDIKLLPVIESCQGSVREIVSSLQRIVMQLKVSLADQASV